MSTAFYKGLRVFMAKSDIIVDYYCGLPFILPFFIFANYVRFYGVTLTIALGFLYCCIK